MDGPAQNENGGLFSIPFYRTQGCVREKLLDMLVELDESQRHDVLAARNVGSPGTVGQV